MKIQKAGYHGLYFPDLGITLDGYHPDADYSFVSHAHADHMPRNKNTCAYATSATLDLMKLRGFKGESHPVDFLKPIETPHCRVTLYPAGHILGSAMIFIETETKSILYTGDYRTPPSPATEGFSTPEQVDILITEATFSLPIYRWKSLAKITKEVQAFALQALADEVTPIFLGYNLGKAQEIMHLLAPLSHPVMIHGAGFKLCEVYENHGIDLGSYTAFDLETCKGKILVAPSSALSNGIASNISQKRVAYCSGWAANESRQAQHNIDKLIPLSDHIDFFELIEFCKRLSPEKVWITHTPNPDVVSHYLDNAGIDNGFLKMKLETDD